MIYKYIKKSSARVGTLKAIQNVLDLQQVKIKEVHEIRWCSFYEALSAVYRCWPALIKFFQDEVEKKTSSGTKSANKFSTKAQDLDPRILLKKSDNRKTKIAHLLPKVLPLQTTQTQRKQIQVMVPIHY